MSEELVTQEQVRKMLHIGKKKAKYILDNGIIPCVNTGKKTRQYRVKVSDIEYYMEHPYDFSVGMFPSDAKRKPINKSAVRLDDDVVYEYYHKLLSEEKDMLTAVQVGKIVGYSKTAVYRWIEQGWLKSVCFSGKHLIPKKELLSFLTSPSCTTLPQKSLQHLQHISEIKHQMQLQEKKKQ